MQFKQWNPRDWRIATDDVAITLCRLLVEGYKPDQDDGMLYGDVTCRLRFMLDEVIADYDP